MGAGNGEKNVLVENVVVIVVVFVLWSHGYEANVEIALIDHVLLLVDTNLGRFNFDVWKLFVKFRINTHQHIDSTFRSQPDRERAGLIFSEIINDVVGYFLEKTDSLTILYIDLTGISQLHIIFTAMKELNSEFCLEL